MRIRYTYEVGEHEEAKKLLNIAFDICTDHESLLYAHFCNTAGVIDFELNHLHESRRFMEAALDIRRAHLKPDDEELANSINNMGNIESAEGNIDTALEFFNEAEDIRVKLGDEGAIPLAVTYLTQGRAYYLKNDFEEALDRYNQAETIALRFAGRNSILLAKYTNLPQDNEACNLYYKAFITQSAIWNDRGTGYEKRNDIMTTPSTYTVDILLCISKLHALSINLVAFRLPLATQTSQSK